MSRGRNPGLIDPDDVRCIHVDGSFSAIICLLFRKDEIRSLINIHERHVGITPGSGNMHFSSWLCPERTSRHPHISGIRIIVVNGAANDDCAVGDIVKMWWRREAVHKPDEKA